MNWATIAPETRLFKGKNLFRWEDSPGLEHHCGVCATPLHNSRAKTSCIGKHVEPCYRFHQQLHFVGKSHECFGCNSSDELHHGRHKEILRLVRQIAALDEASSLLTPSRSLFGKGRRTSDNSLSVTDTSSESQPSEEAKMTRRERKKAKKASNNSVKDKHNMEVFPQEELDFISEAIHLTVHESKGAWEGTYVYDHTKPEEEAVPEEENQDETDLESIASSINDLAVKSPGEMTPRQRKTQKKFNSAINHSSFNGGSRKYGTPKTDHFDRVDPDIFSRLGIEIANPANNSKERKDLTTKLVEAVKEDINIIKREDEDTVMREEGFWRWAGRNAYYYISETRKDFDWATGQKRGPPKFDFPEEDVLIEEGVIVERPLPPLPEPEPISQPEKAPDDEEFTLVTSKKPTVVKTKKEIKYMQTRSAKKALKRPLPPLPSFQQDFEPIEEEQGEDFQEMIRRHEQRVAGEGILGRWIQPRPPYIPPRTRGMK
ncbi:uncharacterized protein LY89DRAFT_782612 [Mollisia scopiformis]|uniref:Uncharacterized protein n=1 Tax=Mollisia scopiformis TaxID=149040 RepID=A0A194X983_MOLSC|nr:uncharacterized protein LY89DRAFT_782612 [Mollisia scopiformis]KUJ16342.1 hypothetical protein LY89DRAFT_782612 [Mollisia scopiformis]